MHPHVCQPYMGRCCVHGGVCFPPSPVRQWRAVNGRASPALSKRFMAFSFCGSNVCSSQGIAASFPWESNCADSRKLPHDQPFAGVWAIRPHQPQSRAGPPCRMLLQPGRFSFTQTPFLNPLDLEAGWGRTQRRGDPLGARQKGLGERRQGHGGSPSSRHAAPPGPRLASQQFNSPCPSCPRSSQ